MRWYGERSRQQSLIATANIENFFTASFANM
jgi:hypothetical protein